MGGAKPWRGTEEKFGTGLLARAGRGSEEPAATCLSCRQPSEGQASECRDMDSVAIVVMAPRPLWLPLQLLPRLCNRCNAAGRGNSVDPSTPPGVVDTMTALLGLLGYTGGCGNAGFTLLVQVEGPGG